MTKLYIGLFIFITLTSCSDREKKDRAIKDLDATQQGLINLNKHISDVETDLTRMIGELEVAKDDMNQVKEFQLLRTEEEREQQIRKSTEYRLKIEQNIESIKLELLSLKDSVTRTEMRIGNLKELLKN